MTQKLLSIDPGKHACGWALFHDGRLHAVGHSPREIFRGFGGELGAAVVERPRIYPQGHPKPQDLIDLAGVAAAAGESLAMLGFRVDYVEPAEWKGQAKKSVGNQRVWCALLASERDTIAKCFPKESVQTIAARIELGTQALARTGKEPRGYSDWNMHNVLDAVGIGLHALGKSRLSFAG